MTEGWPGRRLVFFGRSPISCLLFVRSSSFPSWLLSALTRESFLEGHSARLFLSTALPNTQLSAWSRLSGKAEINSIDSLVDIEGGYTGCKCFCLLYRRDCHIISIVKEKGRKCICAAFSIKKRVISTQQL